MGIEFKMKVRIWPLCITKPLSWTYRVLSRLFCSCFDSPVVPRPHCWVFTITLRHTTLDWTPLDEWSARRIGRYLRNTQQPQHHSTSDPYCYFVHLPPTLYNLSNDSVLIITYIYLNKIYPPGQWKCCIYGCMFCMFLFHFVNDLFLLLCYVFLSLCYVILIVMYVPFCVFRLIMLFCVLFVCRCVLGYCHWDIAALP
jgi:hypothetical protein